MMQLSADRLCCRSRFRGWAREARPRKMTLAVSAT